MALKDGSRKSLLKWKKLMPFGVLLIAGIAASMAFTLSADSAAQTAATTYRVRVVKTLPHDPSSFSQGLAVHQGQLLEGTGQYGKSRLRRLDTETGRILKDLRMEDDIFGEGVTVWDGMILQLTWKNGFLIVYDAETFERIRMIPYRDMDPTLREGWGITHDGQQLIISDGSATLRFVDPATFRLTKTLVVRHGWRSLSQLNELEYIEGEIFANVWYRDEIARIDPQSGAVKGWLDLSSLKPREVRFNREAVLNGIAWDSQNRRLFVTGKNWPSLFEIQIVTGKSR